MYNITREQASEELKISTRSIDRYIKGGKLRSKKEGKIVYIHQGDIEKMLGKNSKQEVIITEKKSNSIPDTSNELSSTKEKDSSVLYIYQDLKTQLKQKDEEIKKLHQDIGKMQEVVKNSISLLDYKKSHFLLEESKNSVSIELQHIKQELEKKEIQVQEERKLNYILIAVTCIIFFMMIGVWFIKI